ncbi:hypothetical protein CIK05_11325 [Bdellovibrio sp. qaytius]|nr:hypothetical protein CIK05_11325 [Bdellovibrio sp. qaytius]
MKKQIATVTLGLALIAASSTSFANTINHVKDLAIDCTIKVEVKDVTNANYDPGAPAHHRFPGIEPSLTAQGSAKVIEQSTGCEVLQSKYAVNLSDLTFTAWVNPPAPVSKNDKLGLVGQTYEMKLKQYIGYQNNEGYLPLFSLVHAETLNFEFSSPTLNLGAAVNFDLNAVYGLTPVEKMTDTEKLTLAEKIKTYGLMFNYDFHNLFLTLEPNATELKKAYAFLIWGGFNQYTQAKYYDSFMLEFHVGGPGSYTGQPLAVKLNEISHVPNLFSSNEIVQLITDYPTWLLAGYGSNQCLNFAEKDLELALANILAKLPAMNPQDKWLLQDPINSVAGKINFLGSSCLEGKVSEKAKDLALEISKTFQ